MMLSPVLVKLIADVEIVPGAVKVDAGTFVMVLREYEGETFQGKHTLLGFHDAVQGFAPQGFYVRPWEYTADLGADVTALQRTRIENLIHTGYAAWSEEDARKRSGEVDSGCHWKLHGVHAETQTWRVSWIENTGELYAVCIAGRGGGDAYMVLGRTEPKAEARAEWFVEGWSNFEAAVYDNLTALREQIQARSAEKTPQEFLERFVFKQRFARSIPQAALETEE